MVYKYTYVRVRIGALYGCTHYGCIHTSTRARTHTHTRTHTHAHAHTHTEEGTYAIFQGTWVQNLRSRLSAPRTDLVRHLQRRISCHVPRAQALCCCRTGSLHDEVSRQIFPKKNSTNSFFISCHVPLAQELCCCRTASLHDGCVVYISVCVYAYI
jgi:hypothetical protein